jgi:hypothetical protein
MVRPPEKEVIMKQIRFSNHLPLILCLIFLLTEGCSDQGSVPTASRTDLLQITIHQGIAGRVWFWEGDFMPMSPSGKITPAVRKVLVYTPTRTDSALRVGYGGFYSHILTTLVAEATSNDSGFFQVTLQSGRYSLFVKEDTLFYANSFDGEGYIQPVNVLSDSITAVRIDITYRATF